MFLVDFFRIPVLHTVKTLTALVLQGGAAKGGANLRVVVVFFLLLIIYGGAKLVRVCDGETRCKNRSIGLK